jgi:ubiquinone/menaquinone biosynthesis C-methylase UbiE
VKQNNYERMSRLGHDPTYFFLGRTMGNNAEINARKWDDRAETYDNKIFDVMRYMQKRLIDILPLKTGIHCLDLGCGTGWAVRNVAKRCNYQGEFFGVDISPVMLQKAEEKSVEDSAISYKLGNAEELPFNDSYFNLIICTNSFHHYQNPQKVINEIKRVLKLGGSMYIMDLTDDIFLVSMFNKYVSNHEAAHVKFYSTQNFRELFLNAGLDYVENRSIFGLMKIHIAKKPENSFTKSGAIH